MSFQLVGVGLSASDGIGDRKQELGEFLLRPRPGCGRSTSYLGAGSNVECITLLLQLSDLIIFVYQ